MMMILEYKGLFIYDAVAKLTIVPLPNLPFIAPMISSSLFDCHGVIKKLI